LIFIEMRKCDAKNSKASIEGIGTSPKMTFQPYQTRPAVGVDVTQRARPEAYSKQPCLLYQLRYPTSGMVKIDFRWTISLNPKLAEQNRMHAQTFKFSENTTQLYIVEHSCLSSSQTNAS